MPRKKFKTGWSITYMVQYIRYSNTHTYTVSIPPWDYLDPSVSYTCKNFPMNWLFFYLLLQREGSSIASKQGKSKPPSFKAFCFLGICGTFVMWWVWDIYEICLRHLYIKWVWSSISSNWLYWHSRLSTGVAKGFW